jgi:4-alpha-glucanotransferase
VVGGFTVWQTLPLGPPHEDASPYRAQSAFAMDPRLLSIPGLNEDGWVSGDAAPAGAGRVGSRTLRERVMAARPELAEEFEAYRLATTDWLPDFSLFCAIRASCAGAAWWTWPVPLRDRGPEAMDAFRVAHVDAIADLEFEQYLLDTQWRKLRAQAHERGVVLFGDLPLFVAQDSADVWAHRELFKLDQTGQPRVVAGVPPDYFSATGQRWGNPQFDWKAHERQGFKWWRRRLEHDLTRFDLVRLDHFRGLESVWEIPADSETALTGDWIDVPGAALLKSLKQSLGSLPLVAEDLGMITPEVTRLRDAFDLPGMKILQFAFGGDADNPYLPHNLTANSVTYTGTHDNDTLSGWWASLAAHQQHDVLDYLGCGRQRMPGHLIRTALASVSRIAILPMQDLLGLDSTARMNVPGMLAEGNWRWRFDWSQVPQGLSAEMGHWNRRYGRC